MRVFVIVVLSHVSISLLHLEKKTFPHSTSENTSISIIMVGECMNVNLQTVEWTLGLDFDWTVPTYEYFFEIIPLDCDCMFHAAPTRCRTGRLPTYPHTPYSFTEQL